LNRQKTGLLGRGGKKYSIGPEQASSIYPVTTQCHNEPMKSCTTAQRSRVLLSVEKK